MKRARVPITQFAPAERVSIEIVRQQAARFQQWPLPSEWRDSPFQYIFVLNRQRQVVCTSRNVHQLIHNKGQQELLGMRPGEALDCIRASEAEGGCGTSESCRSCGATQAILNGLSGKPDMREFRLTRLVGCHQEAREYMALAMPLIHNSETFCVFGLSSSLQPGLKPAMEKFFAQQQKRTRLEA